LNGLDPTFVVHGKLIVAAWAAEATRKAAEVRALPGPIAAQILMLLGVDTKFSHQLANEFARCFPGQFSVGRSCGSVGR
jgi:hypothetical protein